MADLESLTDREREILQATVTAWVSNDPEAANRPLRSVASGTPSLHGNWPADVRDPHRDELRPLIHAGWLVADRSQQPDWVLSPTQETLVAFEVSGAEAIAEGLKDPDRRLGLILEAVVDAYAADPSRGISMFEYDHADLVMQGAWQLPPDAARRHDFVLLQDAGLVKVIPTGETAIDVVPTSTGRAVVDNALEALEELIEDAEEDPKTQRRLLRARDKVVAATKATAPGLVSGIIVKVLVP